MMDAARQAGTDVESLLAPVREGISLRRFATDRDVANAIVFWLSDASAAITGQIVYVDGGIGH